MQGILLNITGLICIIISFVYINKFSKKDKDMYEEMIIIHNNVKDYWIAIEKTLDSFDDLLETSLDKVDNLQKKTLRDTETKELKRKPLNNMENQQDFTKAIFEDSSIIENPTRGLYNRIIELKDIGLSNEQIAKKLHKGVREVEIITRMWTDI